MSMKITEVKTDQFAGVMNKDVILKDGVNVIYGPNESGKSTLVNLISRVLFQNSILSKRSDKEFYHLYFPGENKTSISGDFSDGEVTIATEEGTYKLKKEWNKNNPKKSMVRLITPHAIVSDEESIQKELKRILGYGAGVYENLLLSSQYNTNKVLKDLVDHGTVGEDDSDIIHGASKALAETDGVDLNQLQESIQNHISAIEGSHWDDEQGRPAYRPNGRWSQGIGTIHKIWYEAEDYKEETELLKEKINRSEISRRTLSESEKKYKKANADLTEFQKYAVKIAGINARKKNITALQDHLAEYKNALKDWPALESQLSLAEKLSREKKDREILDTYEKVSQLHQQLLSLKKELKENGDPDEQDLDTVEKADRQIANIQSRLKGMNLLAGIQMKHDHPIRITSISDGHDIPLTENLKITEAVKIEIPDVMEMILMPGDMNVEEIQNDLKKSESTKHGILNRYHTETIESLRMIRNKADHLKHEIQNVSIQLDRELNGATTEEIKNARDSILNTPRDLQRIQNDIAELHTNDLEKLITTDEVKIDQYQKIYGTKEDLQKKIKETEAELKEISSETADNIPEHFKKISDPEKYQDRLNQLKENAEKSLSLARTENANAEAELNAYQSELDGDPEEMYHVTIEKFKEQEEELAHWKHILKIFEETKENFVSTPIDDLEKSFSKYLNILSDHGIESDFVDQEHLDMKIYSNDHLMDFDKLSDGTKDTVSLAFRLAVLDHLFPDGGGFIAMDDPLVNMDEKRTEKACELIRKASEKQQIIFLTCRKDIAVKLGGNQIQWDGSHSISHDN